MKNAARTSFFGQLLRPFNLFTALMILAAVSFSFRLVNVLAIVHGGGAAAVSEAVQQAGAQEAPAPAATPVAAADAPAAGGNTAGTPAAAPAGDASAPAAAPAPKDAETAGVEGKPSDIAAKANNPAPPEEEAHAYSAAEVEVLQSLAKRRDELDRREKKIAEHEALLAAAGQEVDHKITELNKLKGEIEALLGKQQKMQEDRITSLVKIYEGMKPKEAATIFNTLDLDVLLTVVGRMNERKSAPILAAMDPDKARLVTIRLAEQRKLPAPPADSGSEKTARPPVPATP